MTIPFSQHFDAWLPAVAAPVRITSIYDAQIFTRRWVIRDKDPTLKLLLRQLERANSAVLSGEAMESFKLALSGARAVAECRSVTGNGATACPRAGAGPGSARPYRARGR